eukprot:TRINITY_DN26118_c0_g1_i3.p1 TRINITY_DN26118_c0_g1~~TRINITY_DN26118_c0_g1_i3.p1  ORF type:complete len:133 (-),score=17.52 TRINITY_DN26118_c0_g1_i3:162-560(-)
MIRRPPRSTQGVSSAASDVYKRQEKKLRINIESQLSIEESKKDIEDSHRPELKKAEPALRASSHRLQLCQPRTTEHSLLPVLQVSSLDRLKKQGNFGGIEIVAQVLQGIVYKQQWIAENCIGLNLALSLIHI